MEVAVQKKLHIPTNGSRGEGAALGLSLLGDGDQRGAAVLALASLVQHELAAVGASNVRARRRGNGFGPLASSETIIYLTNPNDGPNIGCQTGKNGAVSYRPLETRFGGFLFVRRKPF